MTVPSVTVLIDTYNYARFLARAIDSVLAQKYTGSSLEVLVVDDGSTDDTEAVMARYGSRVRYIRKRNGGQGSALNIGFHEARGDVICLLDADDFFYPDKVNLVAQAFGVHSDIGLVYDEFVILDSAGRPMPKSYPEPTWTGRSVPLGRIPAQLQELILLGHPWTTTTSAMSVRRSVVRDLWIPEDVFPHSPDLFLGLVLPFMTGVAAIASPQTGYVFHGENVGLFRSSPHNQETFRRQMAHTRRYIEEQFGRRFLTYWGRGLYGAPPPEGTGVLARWRMFVDERAVIRAARVDPNIRRYSEAKLAASVFLPGRVYDAVRTTLAAAEGVRSRRKSRIVQNASQEASVGSPVQRGSDTLDAARPPTGWEWMAGRGPGYTVPANRIGSPPRPYSGARKAYDAIAGHYDREVLGDAWMRNILWEHYGQIFRAGDSILDVGCGTGLDAVYLARQRINVTAIDISPAMIAQTQLRAAHLGATGHIETAVLDIRDLAVLARARFDGIISSFAGLSALPSLDCFADDAALLLRPGGRLIVHLLNRFSLWEWFDLLSRQEWSRARDLGQQRERTFTIGGIPVQHYMVSVDEAFAAFSRHFHLARAYGLGIFRPPHTLHRIPPNLVEALAALDRVTGAHRPFINWGRFVVLDMIAGHRTSEW